MNAIVEESPRCDKTDWHVNKSLVQGWWASLKKGNGCSCEVARMPTSGGASVK